MSTHGVGVKNVFQQNGGAPVEYRRVYVWELPVRAYHWINAIALVSLCVTGFLIGHPMKLEESPEAYQQYWFGWVRFIHFASAFVYVFNFAARIYWGFVGNKYSHWNAFFPFKKSQRQEIVDVIKADVLETKMHGPISTGHNALAGLISVRTADARAAVEQAPAGSFDVVVADVFAGGRTPAHLTSAEFTAAVASKVPVELPPTPVSTIENKEFPLAEVP